MLFRARPKIRHLVVIGVIGLLLVGLTGASWSQVTVTVADNYAAIPSRTAIDAIYGSL